MNNQEFNSRFNNERDQWMANIEKVMDYFGLSDWWSNKFSETEKIIIIERLIKYGALSGYWITSGKLSFIDGRTSSSFLNSVVSTFHKKKEFTIARKLSEKALDTAEDPYDIHQALRWVIFYTYKTRNSDEDALNIVITACKQQIANTPDYIKRYKEKYRNLLLGYHDGYTYLAKILEKKRDYLGAIQLSTQAKEQGWKGDWDKRIDRCWMRMENKIKSQRIN
jgi:hypothetical protein